MIKTKEIKTDVVRIRCTPKQKKKLLSYCKKHKCKMADLFRPTIDEITD